LKILRTKLKENANIIGDLTNSVTALKTKSGNPSAKLNAKNIELTKQNDELVKQVEDLKIKLTAKSSELDRCQRAAAQKNKTIKELKKSKQICNVPEHKSYNAAEAMKMCRACKQKEMQHILTEALKERNITSAQPRFIVSHPEYDDVMMNVFSMNDLYLGLDSDLDSDSS